MDYAAFNKAGEGSRPRFGEGVMMCLAWDTLGEEVLVGIPDGTI